MLICDHVATFVPKPSWLVKFSHNSQMPHLLLCSLRVRNIWLLLERHLILSSGLGSEPCKSTGKVVEVNNK